MTDIRLDAADANELAELLTFLTDWLDQDRDRLTASLHSFVGTSGYTIGYDVDMLRSDLARFAFLLGDDGERLFGADRP